MHAWPESEVQGHTIVSSTSVNYLMHQGTEMTRRIVRSTTKGGWAKCVVMVKAVGVGVDMGAKVAGVEGEVGKGGAMNNKVKIATSTLEHREKEAMSGARSPSS